MTNTRKHQFEFLFESNLSREKLCWLIVELQDLVQEYLEAQKKYRSDNQNE